ncbi:MAG TPA: serine hydrolase [Acidimicrobiales bacterium]|nr:serine hydrolase [Acidimicrobiales bacterium]
MSDDAELHPLPPQPDGVPWPTEAWPTAAPPPAVEGLVEEMFAEPDRYGTTYAVAVVQGGRLLVERYGGERPSFTGPGTPVEPSTPLLSWSMAKSVLHAAVGILAGEGQLRLDEPAPVPSWAGDERSAITLDHLLQMRDGLQWAEDYVDTGLSDVIDMLFGTGAGDVAAYAEARPLAHPPGTVFNYSSGTSNVVAAIVSRTVGGPDATQQLLLDRLLHPIGMRSADPRFDDAGTFVGSSYVYATAQDWARFGLLYLRDGVWDGIRIVPERWVDHGRRVRSVDPEDGALYGAHWWVEPLDRRRGTFQAIGYEGQAVALCPALDAVVVRLGRTKEAQKPNLAPWRVRVLDALEV